MTLIEIPDNVRLCRIEGYPDGHPNGPFSVDILLKGEDRWKRGQGLTPQAALDAATPIGDPVRPPVGIIEKRPKHVPNNLYNLEIDL